MNLIVIKIRVNYFRDIHNFLELNQTHSTNSLIFFIVIESFNRHDFTGCLLSDLARK